MIDFLMSADFFKRLCQTLLHSVWQVALLALFATVCSWLLCRKNVYWKYTIHVAALIVALLAMPLTFVMVESGPAQANALPIMAAGGSSIKAIPRPEAVDSASASLQPRSIVIPREVNAETTGAIESPASASASVVDADASSDKPSQWWTTLAFWMSGMYLLGVATMLARLLVSILKSSQLASQGQRIKDGPAWEILQNLCSEWSLQVKPSLMQAERIVVPKVVGLIRPAILLPASALTGLSSKQLEMILAHELAHIRRYDMWVYLLQRLAEAALFFNPALWFLNRRISDLREYCCDEMACEIASGSQLDVGEPRLRYAQALLRVVELKQESSIVGVESTAALAAIGHSPSELRRRIARLFDEPLREPVRISKGGIAASTLLIFILFAGPSLWLSHAATAAKPSTLSEQMLERNEALVSQLEQQCQTVDARYDQRNGVRHLKRLELWKASEQALKTLGSVEGLEELSFVATDLRTPKFAEIEKLKTLKQLSVINGQFLPAQLSHLEELTALEHLELMFTLFDQPLEKRLQLLGNLSANELKLQQALRGAKIRDRVIEATLLTDRGMEHLSKLIQLKSLKLINTNIAAGIVHLQPLTQIETLEVGFLNLDRDSISPLLGMKHLKSLRYFNANDALVSELAKIDSLKELDIWAGDVTDAGAEQLAKLTNIRRLEIRGNQLTDAGLNKLNQLPDLEYLDLKFAKQLTTAGLGSFQKKNQGVKIKHSLKDQPSDAKAIVAGKILKEDGSPADVKGWMLTDLRRPNGNGESGTQDQYVDKFSFETGAGTMWLTYYADGYAPVWTDKFEIKPGEKRDDFRLTLKSGISTKVRVSDEKGQPIAGATIVAHPEIHGTCQGPVFKHTTDENGEYQMTHLAKTRYQLKITASGFQPLQTAPLRVEDGETLRPTMVRSQPSTGIVRFADGTPAPYSKIRCKYEMRANGRGVGHGNEGEGFLGSVFATADENGRFNMDELAEGSRYLMIVEAVDGTRAIVHDLQAGQEDVQVVLPRRRDLVVKIKGDLNKYTKPNRKPFVAIRQSVAVSFKPGQNWHDLIGADAPIELTPDGGMVIFRGLAVDLDGPGKGQQKVSVTLGYDHETKQTVDLNLTGGTIVEFDLSDEVKSDQPSPETKQDGILWGESQDGLKLGIRPSDLSRHATRFRHGDVIAYEAWVKNETKTTIHVPYDPRHIYGPSFKDNKFELLNQLSWVRYGTPLEVFDKSVVSLSPGEAKPYPKGQQLQGSIQPVGTDGEHSGSALFIPIGTYDCLANYEFNYQEGLKYDRRDTRNDKRVKLSSGVAKIQVLPSARLEIREAALVSESKIDRSILAKDATRKFINWEMIDGQKDELFFNRFAPPITNEDDVISAVAKPSEHDSESYSVYLRLTPRAGQRLFSKTTRLLKNVASSRPRLPILLDGKVLMAPMLQSTLKEQIAITGNFTKAEAQQLATEISSASAITKQNASTAEPVSQPLSAVPNNAFLVAEVVDAETGKPIDKFTALAGVSRMEGLGWQWQPHTIHAYQNGQLQWPPAKRRGYDKQVLRVEADGYLPYETPLLIKLGPDEVAKPAGARGAANGETVPNALQGRVGEPATFKILLRRDAGTRGRVLDPDGKPVQGAIVAIGMGNHRTVRLVNRSIKIIDEDSNASLRDQWEVPRHTTTDSTGKFELPTETAPGAIVAVHQSGIAVVSVAEFQRGSDLQLQPWGRIEGQIDWGDASAEGEKISLFAYGRPHTEFRPGFSFVSQSAKAVVDKSGKFTFKNVPPGAVQLGRESNPPGDWNGSTILNPVWHVSVDAGKTLAYVIGGPGRPVTGKVTDFDNWKNVTVSITKELHYPRPGWLTNPKDPTWPAFNAYMASPAYKFFNKDAVNIEADGTFRVENVAAESYVVTVMEKTGEQVIKRGHQKLTVEPMPDGKSNSSLDVGIIQMDPVTPSKNSRKSEKSLSTQKAN